MLLQEQKMLEDLNARLARRNKAWSCWADIPPGNGLTKKQ